MKPRAAIWPKNRCVPTSPGKKNEPVRAIVLTHCQTDSAITRRNLRGVQSVQKKKQRKRAGKTQGTGALKGTGTA
jgi:hypothetical protein